MLCYPKVLQSAEERGDAGGWGYLWAAAALGGWRGGRRDDEGWRPAAGEGEFEFFADVDEGRGHFVEVEASGGGLEEGIGDGRIARH